MKSERITTTLGNLLSFSNGKSSPERSDNLSYPVYGSNGIIGFSDQVNALPGTIIIGRVGSYCGSLHFSNSSCWVTDNAIRANAINGNDEKFLFYMLHTLRLNDFRVGSGQPLLNQTILSQISTTIPIRSEQRYIAHILGTLDEKIELNRQMNKTLEATARAIFKSWFIDFDPVKAKVEGRKPACMDTETAALFPSSFQNSVLGKIPKGWEVTTIDEDFNVTMGQSPPGSTYNEDGNGMPFYQGRKDFGFRYPTRRVYCSAPKRFAEKGDTLVSVRAPVGDVNMVEEKCSIGRGVAAIRHNTGSRSYTYYTMQSLQEVFSRYEAEGTVFGSINKTDFQTLSHLRPPNEIIEVFERLVYPLDQSIENNENESRTLAQIRDTLLPKLLSGEIRVDDAAEMLEVTYMPQQTVPNIELLHVKNYRALRDIELKQLKPLTVFLGSNGSGKSTLFDVFAFLSECFTIGLRQAWNKRGGFKELRTRGCYGPIEFELKYREEPKTPLITYHFSINEDAAGPFVETEWLQWRPGRGGKHVRFLNFHHGIGSIIPGEKPNKTDKPIDEQLDDPSGLAVNMFGQLARHPRVSALRRFITDWHLSYLSTDATRQATDDGPQKRLSATGDNLPNVIQYLQERYPERLEKIISILSNRVPRLEKVDTELMMSGRRLLKIKDAPFEQPILAKFASDGTLKLLSYLTLFHDPQPPQLIGIEEPENYLHQRLLTGLVGECLEVSAMSQLIITTHSPRFVNELSADEVWMLYRDEQGFTVCKRASEMLGIEQLLDAGAKLGQLWMEGHFEFGDPLTNAGGPNRGVRAH